MDYKPYTAEWNRKRYLSEAIEKYFDDNVSSEIIVDDIIDTLEKWASLYRNKTNKLEDVLNRLR